MSNTPNDDVGGERTDELPILIETTVLDAGDAPQTTAALDDGLEDTAERTASYPAFATPDPDASAELAELREELAAREARIATLENEIAGLNARLSVAATQLATKDSEIAALKRIVDDVGTALAEHQAAAQEARAALAQRSVEHARSIAEVAALQGSLAAMQAEREKLGALHGTAGTTAPDEPQRVADLERELAATTTALRGAEILAASEIERAKAARAELILKAREVESLRRALAERRAGEAAPQHAAPARSVPAHRDQRLAELESAILDRERAIAAKDARIAALQKQLDALPPAPPSADARVASEGRQSPKAPGAELPTPTLVCLTGDAPKRFVLANPETLLGRGQHCDVQILTRVVSREHARISRLQDRAFIEDLDSSNGVFVNAVRVTRQPLREGDLITLGETQFRFVETVAH